MTELVKIVGQALACANDLKDLSIHEDRSSKTDKKVFSDSTEKEQQHIHQLQIQLRNKISYLRTNRICARSQIKLDANNGAIEVLRQIGKSRFKSAGDINFCKILFHLEMNHVEIYKKSLPLSLEEAYCLMLSGNSSMKFDKFVIITTLIRAGFAIKQPDENADYNDKQIYVWQNLFDNLGFYWKSNHCFEPKRMQEIKSQFENIKTKTLKNNIPSSDTAVQGIERKRKCPDDSLNKSRIEPPTRRVKVNHCSGTIRTKIQNIYDSIKIKRVSNYKPTSIGGESIKPHFDLYINEKSKNGPNYRVLIIDKKFPSISNLSQFNCRQKLKLPLICFNVEDTRNIQNFLLYIN